MNQYDFQFNETASIHINIIRIIAAHLVVIGHGIMGRISPIWGGMIGAPGLGLFFAMSGVLISHTTLRRMKDERYEFKRFVLKRFSRIYPTLFLALIVMAIIDGIWYIHLDHIDILDSYNIKTFLWNLLILQESMIGPTCFGNNRQLWPFPLFWWTYLFFGWLLLGFRNTNKKYLYCIILGLFTFILIFICLGEWTSNKIEYLSLWFMGALFSYVINKIDLYIEKKSAERKNNWVKASNKLKNRIKYSALIISIILYILSIIRLLTHRDPYGIWCLLLLTWSFFSFIIFSQYIHIIYSEKVKKIVNFMANYTYSLFLIQYSAGYLLSIFKVEANIYFYIFLIYLFSNLMAIAIAYFTEMRSNKTDKYLAKKFNLELN